MTRRTLRPLRLPDSRWMLHALGYGLALAVAAFALEWADYRHRSMAWSTGLYVLTIAIGFAALGGWIGHQLTARPAPPFTPNLAAIATLGISPRELEVLSLLAEGRVNKLIARDLAISPNTVKTHIARLFEKLEASNRTEAIARARALAILP